MTEQKIHELKSWPALFEALVSGIKTHEMRNADRAFRVGDLLQLREYDPTCGIYSGRQLSMIVTYITSAENPCALSEDGLGKNYCILSVRKRA